MRYLKNKKTSLKLSNILDTFSAMRIRHWLKNIIIFIPILVFPYSRSLEQVILVTKIFTCFCLCASATYLLNDLLDIQYDRQDILKKNRSIASNKVSKFTAVLLSILLLIGTLAVALSSSNSLLLYTITLYFLTSTLYSLCLKKIILLDLITLSCLYLIRVLAGSIASNIEIVFLPMLSLFFIFLALSCLKRLVDLQNLKKKILTKELGRGYRHQHKKYLLTLCLMSGIIAIISLFLDKEFVTLLKSYKHSQYLWLVLFLTLPWFVYFIAQYQKKKIKIEFFTYAVNNHYFIITCLLIITTILFSQ